MSVWAQDLSSRLDELTDPITIERGATYAGAGRVIELTEGADRITAVVAGTDDYHVELSADSWFCDCPVGVMGAFCKHCVAVAVSVAVPSDESTGQAGVREAADVEQETFSPDRWLHGLTANELRDLLLDACIEVDGMVEFVARRHATITATTTGDMSTLMTVVADTFTPDEPFYDYLAANQYADDVEPVVDHLEDLAENAASAQFLAVVQRAIELAVRAIRRSDDSSGSQGMQIGRLLDAHAKAAAAAHLTDADVTALVNWLFTFRFGGTQDVIDIDICEYADVIGAIGAEQYRGLLDQLSKDDAADHHGIDYARRRLAVLHRDPEEIIQRAGGQPQRAYQFAELVDALHESGYGELAAEYARQGIAADPHSHQVTPLVTYAAEDARRRGQLDEVVRIRRDDFQNRPSTTTYKAFERDATAAGVWDAEHAVAGELLARVDPRGWVLVLHDRGDDDAAWTAARAHPDGIDVELWERLFRRRIITDPASTLPLYRRVVDRTLVHAGRHNYRTAARLLRRMRDAAEAAGTPTEFTRYLADVIQRNRRRPAFAEELLRARVR
ncbi:SWIM zinc finger family protein [Phytoactinopolyspora limicola]|uniref:SWIM zinc finger family protein n=1 Tax=Phytoactinopolyspora limicola TaxID=2715536 RepID=UPI00140BA82F|nr:hypothetical protein [Phytoactinopolyspora limicola]